jgi:hypothetical protein
VRGDYGVPVIDRHVHEVPVPSKPGVVDENLHNAQLAAAVGHRCAHRHLVGHVGLYPDRLPARPANRLGDLLDANAIDVQQDHPVAERSEIASDSCTDAAR